MESDPTNLEQLSENRVESCGEWHDGGSFSASFMSRTNDISFGGGSPACDAQSPTFTCKSSFSSIFVEPVTPFSASGGFSFRSSGGPIGLEFSTPVSSMPSFAFLSHSSVVEQKNLIFEFDSNTSEVNAIAKGMYRVFCLNEYLLLSVLFLAYYVINILLLLLPDSPLSLGNDVKEKDHKPVETKRACGTNCNRTLGFHSKRNRTIGLGECEQLDLVVTESVIRWLSCTQLPTSPKSSLVC